MKSQQWRGLDFFNPNKPHPSVLIIGCGHIGSYLAFGLARMGVKKITVVDHDMVEPHNLPNQFFAESLVKDLPDTPTLYKVVALQQTIKYLVSAEITAVPSKIETANLRLGDYECIMVAVDDMNVRKWIWDNLHSCPKKTRMLIDARTGGAFANVFAIPLLKSDPSHIYSESLYDNEEAAPLPCTGTAIIDVSLVVVGICIQKYREFVLTENIVGYHTFIDCVVGTSSLMRVSRISTGKDNNG